MIRSEDEIDKFYGHLTLPQIYMQFLGMTSNNVQSAECLREEFGNNARNILNSHWDELECLMFAARKKIKERA